MIYQRNLVYPVAGSNQNVKSTIIRDLQIRMLLFVLESFEATEEPSYGNCMSDVMHCLWDKSSQ